MKILISIACFIAGLAAVGMCAESWAADIPTRGPVINIVEWDAKDLPPVYERSDQLPLSKEDIVDLSKNDFAPDDIARMIQERRFVGAASASALIDLKQQGANPEVIRAVSRHALPPNRFLNLSIQMDFEGTSTQARKRYLYVILPDGQLERVFTADLGTVLAGRWRRDVKIDHTDLMLPKQIRRIIFADRVPLKTYGSKTIKVLTSTRPDIHLSQDIPEADAATEFTFEYPESSLQQDCTITVRYKQDALVPYKWKMVSSHVQCEWN